MSWTLASRRYRHSHPRRENTCGIGEVVPVACNVAKLRSLPEGIAGVWGRDVATRRSREGTRGHGDKGARGRWRISRGDRKPDRMLRSRPCHAHWGESAHRIVRSAGCSSPCHRPRVRVPGPSLRLFNLVILSIQILRLCLFLNFHLGVRGRL